MQAINIYALTRISDPQRVSCLERQMSKRRRYLKIKTWELEGLRAFCGNLCAVLPDAEEYDFYYSFVMPKLGKEFDLLRIYDDRVLNVELKSGNVSDELIRRQLIQNKYYLAMLGKTMYFYTYISNSDRLVRLSNSGRLVEADWEDLRDNLLKPGECYKGDIEDLFKEDQYLISPLTDPGKFLRKEYFLTSQQRDIKKQILRKIRLSAESGGKVPLQGFTGFPGTGKTILLYDLAMELSRKESVCIFHFGHYMKELEQLDNRLKRIDFYYGREGLDSEIKGQYSVILADEGHNIDRAMLDKLISIAGKWNAPLIISYDREDALSPDETGQRGATLIERTEGFSGYRLTNRIRLNTELSAFIRRVMHYGDKSHKGEYPSVSLAYGNDEREAARLLLNFEKEGYVYIKTGKCAVRMLEADGAGEDIPVMISNGLKSEGTSEIDIADAEGREYPKVVMLIDESYNYDDTGYLRYAMDPGTEGINMGDTGVRDLFHGLSRAKEKVALVVKGNVPVFDKILGILQRVDINSK